MKDHLETLRKWIDERRPFVMARVLQTWGSSPRPAGSLLLISDQGDMHGSVSGGCVEGAVVREALKIMGRSTLKVLEFGVSDEEAWTVGLSCGGKLKVLLQDCSQLCNLLETLLKKINSNQTCAWITELRESGGQNLIVDHDGLSSAGARTDLRTHDLLKGRGNEIIQESGAEYFVHLFPKKSQLLIIGAAHITSALVKFAHEFDFETVVIDPRQIFTSKTFFETAPDRIVDGYPSEVLGEFALDESTFAVVLSHDPKIDDNALEILLRSHVAYIGALGSRKTHEKRLNRLKAAGFSESELSRIESPVGIDIDAMGAKEIALSIVGSLIKTRNRGH